MDALPSPETTCGLSEDDAKIWHDSQALAQQVQFRWVFLATVAAVAALVAAVLVIGHRAKPESPPEVVTAVQPATLDPFER